ncbi:hypothetical protein BC936DRAFT_148540 [Jimgerdemannia flammicorona]|uniref:Uncharacterized protein n=1 Tax=Jimgerdemannia flammicorona TaxID=994334 RepID=A0A433D2V0_9FUNG|nr:hypothetical protein BC936DRAFT_148540 [Jimgerdemannia flammicorona]
MVLTCSNYDTSQPRPHQPRQPRPHDTKPKPKRMRTYESDDDEIPNHTVKRIDTGKQKDDTYNEPILEEKEEEEEPLVRRRPTTERKKSEHSMIKDYKDDADNLESDWNIYTATIIWKKYIVTIIQSVNETWTQLLQRTTKTYVVIDDTYELYGKDMPFLWNKLKKMQTMIQYSNLRVLLLSQIDTYQISTNVESKPIRICTLRIGDLYLSKHEFQTVASLITMSDIVRDMIYNLTGGHPGLTVHVLKDVYKRFKDDSSNEILRYLLSQQFFDNIKNSNALRGVLKESYDDDETTFLCNTINRLDRNTLIFDTIIYDTSLQCKFILSGLIVPFSMGCLKFVAPIVHIIIMQIVYHMPRALIVSDNADIRILLVQSIRHMRQSVLMTMFSNDDKLRRKADLKVLKTEWYQAIQSVLPLETLVVPDTRSVFKTPGMMDFYIGGEFDCGIEVWWDGSGIELNFTYNIVNLSANTIANYIAISFCDNFSSANLSGSGINDISVTLMLSNGETVPILLWQTTTWTMLHQRLGILYPSYTFSTHNNPASFVVDGDISDIYIPVIGKRKYSSISPPSYNEVKTFDTHILIEHLHDYGIVCDHTVLNVLINEKIAGQSFLLQTTESLKLCGISLDTATTITEYINEINANDPSRVSKATMATKRVSEFNSKWHDHPHAILVSPPYSGKTIFGSALKQFLENKGRKVISISMKLVLSNDGLYAKSKDCFDMFWIDQMEISWSDILECTD